MSRRLPIVYQDGIRVVAVCPEGSGYPGVRFGISQRATTGAVELVLSQSEARELAAALTWIINEVDEAFGYASFKPSLRAIRPIAEKEASK